MMKYSELEISSEPGAMCLPCGEYKGMMDCTECGATLCVFCMDGCESCGTGIDWSA